MQNTPEYPEVRNSPLWNRCVRQVFCDVRLWLALMVLFVLYRGLLLWIFRANMEEGWYLKDIWLCFFRGLAYDNVSATLAIMPSLVVGILLAAFKCEHWAFRFRTVMIWMLSIVSSLLAVINIGFFGEYKDQFNQWIFGVIYDDFDAILKTMWRNYPIVWILLGIILLIGITGWLLVYLTRQYGELAAKISAVRKKRWRTVWLLVLAAGLVFGSRGSFGRRPIQQKDAAVTQDRFINALVPNYYAALKFAILGFNRQTNRKELPSWLQENGGIRAALTLLYGERAKSVSNMDVLLEQPARGNPTGKQPRHIFLVVLESGDMWPMLPQYSDLGLMPEIQRLAGHGVLFSRFLSTGEGTMPSLAAIISGLPNTGVPQNYQPLSHHPFPTSLPTAFKKMGYKTRLYYGGFLSWQRLGLYAENQGFENIHGGGDMVCSYQDMGEWGVPDGELFNYIAKNTGDEPTFNLIMTTSYHPPYSLDVDKLGCAIERMPDSLKEQYDGHVTLKQFAHMRYVDRELGRFIREFEQKYPDSVFAITGDHWSRRFLNEHPTLYESRAVPLVLYGPQTLGAVSGERSTPGSHMDIAPTLIGLAAPKNFIYHSFGRDLLDSQHDAERPFAEGCELVITATDLAELDGTADAHAREVCQAWLGAAWWRLLWGPELPHD